jgi:hypothetical protein
MSYLIWNMTEKTNLIILSGQLCDSKLLCCFDDLQKLLRNFEEVLVSLKLGECYLWLVGLNHFVGDGDIIPLLIGFNHSVLSQMSFIEYIPFDNMM